MAVQVTFLGSGDAFGSGGRFQTCILVRARATSFLLDCGASSLVAIKRQRIDPNTVDAVLITHLHGDHFGGLPFLVLDAQFSHRRRPLLIAGPPGLEARTKAAMEVLFPGSSATPQQFALEFLELPPKISTSVGPLAVTPSVVIHACGAPAYAHRVEIEGIILGYSGDTEWTPELAAVARDADLFICEAYFFEKKVRYHLDYRTLAEHLAELGCKRILLTHMSEDMLRHLSDTTLEAAKDGQTYVV